MAISPPVRAVIVMCLGVQLLSCMGSDPILRNCMAPGKLLNVLCLCFFTEATASELMGGLTTSVFMKWSLAWCMLGRR
jgi:hypothetical protein